MWWREKYNTPYFTQMFYPEREFHDHLTTVGREYFDRWKKKLKLRVYFVISHPLPERVLGQYRAHWRTIDMKDPFGEILIDVEKHRSEEQLFETIRHELVHAVCDLRYNAWCGHGALFIRLAKLMRVNVKQYEHKHC